MHVCVFKSDKGPTPPECKDAPEPTSETTPDETVITVETDNESKDDESTPPSSQSHRSDTYILNIYHSYNDDEHL